MKFRKGMKVLWRNSIYNRWELGVFSHYQKGEGLAYCLEGGIEIGWCVPLKGNMKFLGTTEKIDG
jgi:hypothetical protein